jgi:hypothetical protein
MQDGDWIAEGLASSINGEDSTKANPATGHLGHSELDGLYISNGMSSSRPYDDASNICTIPRTDAAGLQSDNNVLKEWTESLELDKAELQHELRTVNLERHGWRLERERLLSEMQQVKGERYALLQRFEALEGELRREKARYRSEPAEPTLG